MNHIITQILVNILLIIITCILTFYFTSRVDKVRFVAEITSEMSIHREIFHKVDPIILLEKHEIECVVKNDMSEVKENLRVVSDNQIVMQTAIAFLVREAGGNPEDFKL
ncbi:MAG: hypothetical protein A2V66_15680 [Ignavibacteria bacterium RBG_13_36_8]|nr:MAG: hypothetical protein A2V66_15680 [Ignavibacteria bacterium RBG_13_36_8]